jgi:hypothetical protein
MEDSLGWCEGYPLKMPQRGSLSQAIGVLKNFYLWILKKITNSDCDSLKGEDFIILKRPELNRPSRSLRPFRGRIFAK